MALTIKGGKILVVGDQLGTGTPCCCNPCDCSSAGFAPAIASDTERGLVYLEFSACIGSGAEGTVDAPQAAGPCDYEGMGGAITGATVTDGGSGYAVLGRVEPTVTASVTGGSGATLSVTLTEGADFLGDTSCLEVPTWSVGSVSVTSGGSGYSDKQAVTFSAAAGDTVVEHAKAYAYVAIEEPQSPSFDIYDQDGNPSAGVGAVLVPTFAVVSGTSISRGGAANPPFCNVPNRTAYQVTGITITNGGSGYAVDDFVEISFANSSDGSVSQQLNAEVTAVTGGGAITAIGITYGGRFGGGFTDTLDSVIVEGCISGGVGKYYREDPSEPPYVAEVTVTIQQEAPSTGNGAVITATVEDDTASADFGKVVSLSLVGAGTGYLSPPLACGLPDKLYITWGDTTAEVPLRLDDDFGEFAEIPCSNPAPCRGGISDPHLEDAGNTWSAAFGTILAPGLECKCDGKLHITVTLLFICYECIAVQSGFGEYLANTVVTRPNKSRRRTACLRFDTDENGCPVGDAEVVSWQTGEQMVESQCSAPIPFCAGCSPWTNHDGTYFPSDPCPCDATCDLELAPTISLMP